MNPAPEAWVAAPHEEWGDASENVVQSSVGAETSQRQRFVGEEIPAFGWEGLPDRFCRETLDLIESSVKGRMGQSTEVCPVLGIKSGSARVHPGSVQAGDSDSVRPGPAPEGRCLPKAAP